MNPLGSDHEVNSSSPLKVVPGAASASDCCEPCRADLRCVAAVFYAGKCTLFAVDDVRKSAGRRTVFLSRPQPPEEHVPSAPAPEDRPPQGAPYDLGLCDWSHHDTAVSGEAENLTIVSGISTPEGCCAPCERDDRCVAAVFFAGRCSLKKTLKGGLRRADGHTTALVQRPPAAEPPHFPPEDPPGAPAEAPHEKTPAPPQPPGSGGDGGGMSTPVIVGVSLAAGACLAIIAAVIAWHCWRRRERRLSGYDSGNMKTFGAGQNGARAPLQIGMPKSPRGSSPGESPLRCGVVTVGSSSFRTLGGIGRGAHGQVLKVRRIDDGELFALKTVRCNTGREVEAAMQEVAALSSLPRHPNLVAIVAHEHRVPTVSSPLDAGRVQGDELDQEHSAPLLDDGTTRLEDQATVTMVMDYHPEGDLQTYLAKLTEPLPEAVLVDFAMQVCSLLHHIHSQKPPVIHRDLKPENVLLEPDDSRPSGLRLVVSDFGIATTLESTFLTTQTGTLPYVAPECWERRYGAPVDMWALGCLVYAMATLRVQSHRVRVMFNEARRTNFPRFLVQEAEFGRYSPRIGDLVCALLTIDSRTRPTAAAALKMLEAAAAAAPPPPAEFRRRSVPVPQAE